MKPLNTQHANVGIIVQARYDSSRFPGKGAQIIWDNETTIAFLLKRLLRLNKVLGQKLILATTNTPDCDCFESICSDIGVHCFRGPKENVFSRFEQCASEFSLDVIVRITGDCVLHCPDLIQSSINKWKAIHAFARNEFIITNKSPFSYCDGFDIEIFPRELICKYSSIIHDDSRLQEHVTSYFYCNPDIIKVNILNNNPSHFTSVRLVLDYPADLEALRKIVISYAESFSEKTPIEGLSYGELTRLELFRRWLASPALAPNYQYLERNSTLCV